MALLEKDYFSYLHPGYFRLFSNLCVDEFQPLPSLYIHHRQSVAIVVGSHRFFMHPNVPRTSVIP